MNLIQTKLSDVKQFMMPLNQLHQKYYIPIESACLSNKFNKFFIRLLNNLWVLVPFFIMALFFFILLKEVLVKLVFNF
jgi:hypothetical protein